MRPYVEPVFVWRTARPIKNVRTKRTVVCNARILKIVSHVVSHPETLHNTL